jgi:hypothetical protein
VIDLRDSPENLGCPFGERTLSRVKKEGGPLYLRDSPANWFAPSVPAYAGLFLGPFIYLYFILRHEREIFKAGEENDLLALNEALYLTDSGAPQ